MTTEEFKNMIRANLRIEESDKDLIILDVIRETLNYCNLQELPAELEPFVRKKVKRILDYEAEFGSNALDIQSIKEGDTSITYDTDKVSSDAIYGLSDSDKKVLQAFRRLRR